MSIQDIFANWRSSAPYLQSILRMIAALMFIMSGTMKLFAYPMGIPPDGGTAVYFTQVWFGGILEVFGAGSATIVDGSKITYNEIAEVADHESFSVCGVQLHVLRDGLVYDYLDRHPMQPTNEFLLPDLG